MTDDDLELLDKLLARLGRILQSPGDDYDASAESTWQKLDVLETGMGPDALLALLGRQGVTRAESDEVLTVLARRRSAGTDPGS